MGGVKAGDVVSHDAILVLRYSRLPLGQVCRDVTQTWVGTLRKLGSGRYANWGGDPASVPNGRREYRKTSMESPMNHVRITSPAFVRPPSRLLHYSPGTVGGSFL